jgi:hypothetical protein
LMRGKPPAWRVLISQKPVPFPGRKGLGGQNAGTNTPGVLPVRARSGVVSTASPRPSASSAALSPSLQGASPACNAETRVTWYCLPTGKAPFLPGRSDARTCRDQGHVVLPSYWEGPLPTGVGKLLVLQSLQKLGAPRMPQVGQSAPGCSNTRAAERHACHKCHAASRGARRLVVFLAPFRLQVGCMQHPGCRQCLNGTWSVPQPSGTAVPSS